MEEFIKEQLSLVLTEQRAMREDFAEHRVENEHRMTKVEVNAGRRGAIYGALTSILTGLGLLILALVKGVL